MRISEFDYELPRELIAQEATPRGRARLLHLRSVGSTEDRVVSDLPALIEPRSLVVLNDTKVIAARLLGEKVRSGGRVEIFLLERLVPREGEEGMDVWRAIGRASKGLKPGTEVRVKNESEMLFVRVLEDGANLRVGLLTNGVDVYGIIDKVGHVPLPPYIERPDRASDRERYQTLFAEHPGAVAAPTAGLHLTEEMLAALKARCEVVSVTLHVGLGTFQAVKVDDLDQHPMHSERVHIGEEVARAIALAKRAHRSVVAIGTTVVRALESACREGAVQAGSFETSLLIQPGFSFDVVDTLFTNFHMPRSTLLALVCAFGGKERTLSAYATARERGYRFLSYGDAMLVERKSSAGEVRDSRPGNGPRAGAT